MSRPKAVIYTRVSTDKQAEEGTSLETQEAACLQKAQEIGAEVVDIISDEGVSGAFYLSRPGIQKALKMLEAGKADRLITLKLERTGRDADVLGLIRKRVHAAGGELVFVDGAHFENNATGNLLFRVNAGFAEYERELIRERTMTGRRKRAKEGLQPSRNVSPYGYHIVTKADVLSGAYPAQDLGTYQVIEEQARWVREIFRRYAQGDSLREVGRWLVAQGVTTGRGKSEWAASCIVTILKNPVFKGQPVWGRTQRRVDETRTAEGKAANYYVRRSENDYIPLAKSPALVDPQTWQTCQERLQENREAKSGSTERKYSLSGLMFCPYCSRRLVASSGSFHCTVKHEVKTRKHYDAKQVERLIVNALVTLSKEPIRFTDALRAYRQARRATPDRQDDLTRLHKELHELEQQEKATAKAQVDALMKGRSTEVYDTLLADIDMKRKHLRTRLAALEPEPQSVPDCLLDGEKIAEVLHRMEAVLTAPEEDMLPYERLALFASFLRSVRPQSDGKTYVLEVRTANSASVPYITTYICGTVHGIDIA